MRLSVVITTFNAAGPLRKCLITLVPELKRIPNLTWEVIVSDDCSTDDTSEMLLRDFPDVKFIKAPSKGYFVQTINRGYAASSGDYILHSQSDIEVVEGSVARLLAFMDSCPSTAACSCRWLTPSTGKLQPANGHFMTLTSELFEWTRLGWLLPNIKKRLRSVHYMESWNRLDNREIDVNLSNFMIFRRKAVDAVRHGKLLFDDRFAMFFCEDELFWQLHKAGWKTYHLGDTFVYHLGSFSMNKINSVFLGKLTLQDRLICHSIILGPIRALIFRCAYEIDSIVTSILKSSGIIQ